MPEKLKLYAELMRLHRPIGIYLLLWPTLWALWIASKGIPDLLILIIFIAGVVIMRSAGCVINDFADRQVDPHVERTRDRPLASGRVSSKEAIGLFIVLALIAFILVIQLNTRTILLSLAAIALAVTYPFMKRYHSLPQVHLGAAFGWAIPMAFTAVTGKYPPALAWLVFIATLLWTVSYDTMYAMADRDDDVVIGVKSTAILFGKYDRLIIACLQILTLALLIAIGIQAELGIIFFLALSAASCFMFYQQYLIRNADPQKSFQAFLNNNWFGMIVFFGIFVNYLYNN